MPLRRENDGPARSVERRAWIGSLVALVVLTLAAPVAGLALCGDGITVRDWTVAGPWCHVDNTPAVAGWAHDVEIIDHGKLIPVARNPALGGDQTLIIPAKLSSARYVPGHVVARFAGFTALRR